MKLTHGEKIALIIAFGTVIASAMCILAFENGMHLILDMKKEATIFQDQLR